MAAPVVVIQKVAGRRVPNVLDGNGFIANGAYVYHLWKGVSLSESLETQDNPNGSGGSFQVETRELPRTLTLQVEIAEDLTVPTDGGSATFQTQTMTQQVATLRGLRNSECNVTTRTFAFKGLLKTVQVDDQGEWDNAGIIAKLTFQIITKVQTGLKLDPNGNILLGSGSVKSEIIHFAIDVTNETDGNPAAEDAPAGAGESGQTTSPPTEFEPIEFQDFGIDIDQFSSFDYGGSGTMGAHVQVNRAQPLFGVG